MQTLDKWLRHTAFPTVLSDAVPLDDTHVAPVSTPPRPVSSLQSLRKNRRMRGKQSVSSCASSSCCTTPVPPVTRSSTLGIVYSWDDLHKWPSHNIACAEARAGTPQIEPFFANVSKAKSVSSAFTGVSADTVATNLYLAQLAPSASQCGIDASTLHPRHIASIGKSRECRIEQQCLPHSPPEHTYGDTLGFASPDLKSKLVNEHSPCPVSLYVGSI